MQFTETHQKIYLFWKVVVHHKGTFIFFLKRYVCTVRKYFFFQSEAGFA